MLVMISVIHSGGTKMRDEHGMLRGVYISFLVMTSVILSGGTKIRAEHGILRGVYISCHNFCNTFRRCEKLRDHGMLRGGYISGHAFCPTFRWDENQGRAWNA